MKNRFVFRQTTVPTVIFRGGIIPTKPHITIYILISYILYIRVIIPHFLIVVTVYCRILNWVHFSLQGPIGFRIGARSFSFLYPAPRQQPLCSFSAPTQPLGIPKRAARVCDGYAYTMRRVCEGYAKGMPVCWVAKFKVPPVNIEEDLEYWKQIYFLSSSLFDNR